MIALLLPALAVLLVLGVGAGEDDLGGYKVRAIFDNVAAAVPGEDVKVAGAEVGRIESMDVTPQNKAAVVMRITEEAFAPFRADARCTIRPQSLIGEKFVECEPGSSRRSELEEVPEGEPGEGQHLLPLSRTSSPVDIDLINNIARRPFRERLGILINEFGTGLAGRGQELNEVIHRANPALRETDQVLAILADQNQVLADLARNSDRVLEPLARERRRVSGFIEEANETASATAERRDDIERSIERLPRFLRELRPTMRDLGALSDEMTPVLRDLESAAPDLNRFLLELGPFSRNAVPAIETLGEATDVGRPALRAARPLVNDLRRFAADARPVSANLDELTQSLDKTGGIERAMDYIFFQTTSVNGFDGVSHYLRAALIANLCSVYVTRPTPGCNANYTETRSIRASGSGRIDPHLARTRRALSSPRPVGSSRPSRGRGLTGGGLVKRLLGLEDPRIRAQREAYKRRIRENARRPASAGRRGAPDEAALDYLLGNDR